ncbi:hypothetical protein [Salirhabdus salicampi]|uniref:hypothetical protein n=1 Tax=Salirhabdus salicampi TaxID=476102 RepID=UPI0020C2ED69|nr:hypothetical protein [Salirhabdus salicampi]MCP8617864.1 hypothetical protein [Salirhabdus salicampi]
MFNFIVWITSVLVTMLGISLLAPKYYFYYGLEGFLFLTFIISTPLFFAIHGLEQHGQKFSDDWNRQGRKR